MSLPSTAHLNSIVNGPGKVTIVAFYFPPANFAGGARPFRFYKYLPMFGYDTNVVTAGPEEPLHPRVTPLSYSTYRGKVAGLFEKVVRKFVTPNDDGGSWISSAARCISESVRDGARFILSTSPPIGTHLAAMWVRKRYPVKWIADFRDPLYGSAFREKSSLLFDRVLEEQIFRQADMIIANTDTLQQIWSDRYPHYASKIRLLWNGFDPEEPVFAQPIPPRDHHVITHAGSIYGPRHPGQLLSSIRRLVDQKLVSSNRLKIRLVGEFVADSLPTEVLDDYRSLTRMDYIKCSDGMVPRERALTAIATSDSLLLLDVCGNRPGLQVPSKLFDYIRIGRPVIAFTTIGSPVERILQGSHLQYQCIYQTDSPGTTDRKMIKFLELTPDTRAASQWFYQDFDGLKQVQQLAGWIDALSQR